MKKITDNTLVKVKVPKHLYESIKKKMALKENEAGKVKVEVSFEDVEDKQNFEQTYGFTSSGSNYSEGYVSVDQIPEIVDTLTNVYGIQVKISGGSAGSMQEKKEDTPEEKPTYAGTKMSKSDVLNKVGKGKQSRKISGDKAKAYQAPHTRFYKESEQIEEDALDYAWVPAAAAGLGIAASVLKNIVSYMKKNNLSGLKGLMQAYKEVGSSTSSSIDRSMGTQS